jgi:hypothetical protein
MKSTIPAIFALTLLVAWPAGEAAAQEPACQPNTGQMALEGRASPYDSTAVNLGNGQLKLCYGRPSAQGRTLVGGEIHPFGEVWRMGANEPTTLHTSVAIRFGDVALAPGSYSLYTIPGEESWEVVVNHDVNRWGIPISADVRSHDIGSVTVPRMHPTGHVETLTFEFGTPTNGSVPLVFEWEEFRIEIPISAGSS